jgi:NAD(P)-dependent dehydrogenase (short-subunit alcohol dehydrogenase family)
MEAFVRVAAEELAHLNIRVNAIRPGLVETGATAKTFQERESLALYKEQKPLGRTGTPDDIAGGIRYLLGPESSWVTGQSFGIEGGNELRKAPNLEKTMRQRWGDELVDACRRGEVAVRV